MEEMRLMCIFVGKAERKKQFERPRRRWENNIGMVLKNIVSVD
jgi:hypothetical protein